MTGSLLPAIPRPPHDPTSLLVDRRLGWSLLATDDPTFGDTALTNGALTLAQAPGALRWLTEPSGSFGGLRLPANVAGRVAEGGDGDLWLLDTTSLVLRRFDPCRCLFETVPCFGGQGSGPRQLGSPGGITVSNGRLYVCDAGNARIAVYVLSTMSLAALWSAPASATAPNPWHPDGVAIGDSGDVYVVDSVNGMVHRFSRHGTYLGHRDGVGASSHIAIGCDGATAYVAGDLDAYRVDRDGTVARIPGLTDDIAGELGTSFGRTSAEVVDASGNIHLGTWCLPPSDLVVDGRGEPITLVAQPVVAQFQRLGTALLGPFDSLIDHCVWHRVILRGAVPSGANVGIETQTSDIELPVEELAMRTWETRQRCTAVDESNEWDALIQSTPGRYLWMRVELTGNGATAPRLGQIEIEFPRISLRRYMPAVYGVEPQSADLTDRLLALFDRELRDTEHEIDNIAALFDPAATPFLDWLASWIGVQLPRALPESLRRDLLARNAELGALRGTRFALWTLLVTYLGLDRLVQACQCDVEACSCRAPRPTCPPTPPHRWTWSPPPLILEHYRLRRWLGAGSSRLGDQAVLWGKRIVNRSQLSVGAQVGVTQLKGTPDPLRDPFHVYAHRYTVFVPASAGSTPERRHMVESLIAMETPAHTDGIVEYVEPRFRIGFQSMIGLDAVIARVPRGVTLGETPVGPASVLTGSAAPLVATARIGTTAVLE